MRIRVATCLTLPEPDADEAPLLAALAAAGVSAELAAWDDPSVDWDAPVPTVIRSTWNYTRRPDAFLAWCERVARAGPLLNPLDVVRANAHKRYLLDLAARGVTVVPTVLVERGAASPSSVDAICDERGFGRIVIKPAIGAGSWGARVFDSSERAAAAAHLVEWNARGDMLVQPYFSSVEGYGERSIIWIDGAITHAIRKSPRFAGDAESVSGPLPISEAERALALAAIEPFAPRILYGRVDMAPGPDGRPHVMELELIEPSLFFAYSRASLDRYVDALIRRVRAA